MHKEVERKFVVSRPEINSGSVLKTHIRQGYLAVDADGREVRIREQDNRWNLTFKMGLGLRRTEIEISLTKTQFDAFWAQTEGRRLEKERYHINDPQGRMIELDVYEGGLEGLTIAEIEFPTKAASERYVVPSWFGREVTDDERYKNRNLAIYGLPGAVRGS